MELCGGIVGARQSSIAQEACEEVAASAPPTPTSVGIGGHSLVGKTGLDPHPRTNGGGQFRANGGGVQHVDRVTFKQQSHLFSHLRFGCGTMVENTSGGVRRHLFDCEKCWPALHITHQ